MKKSFQKGKCYDFPTPSGYRCITVIKREGNKIFYTVLGEEISEQSVSLIREPSRTTGFTAIPGYFTEVVPAMVLNGETIYCYATTFDEKECWERNRIFQNWEQYKLVNRASEMISLVNILEAHDESLDSLLEFVDSDETHFCGLDWSKIPEGKQKPAKTLFNYNIFYHSKDDYVAACMREYHATDMTLNEFIAGEDMRETFNGFVRVLHY